MSRITSRTTGPTPGKKSRRRERRLRYGLALSAAVALLGGVTGQSASAANITVSGDIGTHDPSRMIKDGSTYYVYSTGNNIPMKYSTDKVHWKNGPSVFPNGMPAWVHNTVPGAGNDVWAPDITYVNGQFRLYYAVATWGTHQAAIGLATSPTLNTNASNYKWTDHGAVLTSSNSSHYATIDPAPFTDAGGNQWLAWGSGYLDAWSDPEVFITRLDNNSGLRSSSDTANHPVENGHIEASYVQYHNGYYYLFWNDGGCCSGTSSTYTIHVARSTSVTGPYVDKSGKQSSGSIFYASTGNVHGPGQIGILSEGGTDYYTYHYYPNNGSVLGLGTLTWGSDGWPSH